MDKNQLIYIVGIIAFTLALIIHAQTGRYQFEVTPNSESKLRYYKFDTMTGTAYICGISISNDCFLMTKSGYEEYSDRKILEEGGFDQMEINKYISNKHGKD